MAQKKTQQTDSSAYLATVRQLARTAGKWFFGPAALYLALFYLLQPHYLTSFSSGFFLDSGDGFQNVWNIWWVNHSLGEQGQNPYFTSMIHYPHGTSLIPQTMNIYNGLVAIPLIKVFGLSLVESVNVAVLSAFVLGGVTMFWFTRKLVGKYWPAIIAGALFTFSSYHFAHAQGHLQLVSLQWIPLFLLAFWMLLEKMRNRYALLAAGALFLVSLCDFYYLFWCVILAAMWAVWKLYKRELKLTKDSLLVLGVFGVISAMLIGPLVLALLRLNKHDPLLGSHDPGLFSLDPVTVVMPGGSWYWNTLTDWYWTHLPYLSEMSVFFGFGLLAVLAFAAYNMFLKKPRWFERPSWLSFWWIALIVFGLLSLGPHLKIAGQTLESVPMPYLLLEKIFPTLQISGMPVRWVLIALIAAIIIAAYILGQIDVRQRKGKLLLGLFVLVSLIDLYPMRLPLTAAGVEEYVHVLQALPEGAVIDNAAVSGAQQLRNQTIHEKPMAFGYVTRLPKSVDTKDFQIFADLEEGRYSELCSEHAIRYVTLPPSRPLKGIAPPIIYQDDQALIYDLKQAGGC